MPLRLYPKHMYCISGVLQLGCGEGLPESVPEELLQDDGFLQKFHHALLEVREHYVNGNITDFQCSESGSSNYCSQASESFVSRGYVRPRQQADAGPLYTIVSCGCVRTLCRPHTQPSACCAALTPRCA